MKKKFLFFRWAFTLLLALSTVVTWAQSSADPDHACLNSLQDYWVVNTAGSTYNWVLSGGGIITTGQGTDKIKVSWTSTGDYQLTVVETFTSTTGCSGDPRILNITVDALPAPSIAGNTAACLNSTGNIYSTQIGMTNYAWTVTGGTITAGGTITDPTATITWTSVGAKSVTVNYANAAGCTAAGPTAYDVTVNDLLLPTISGNTSACLNSTGNVYTTQSGMTNYIWSVTGGTITTGGTSTDATATITWTSAGAKSVSVNYSAGLSCTAASPTIYPVTVNDLPVPVITGNAAACLNITGNIYTTQAGMTNYVWSVNGGTIVSGGTSTDATATITWTSAGAKSVSVNYTNGSGCSAAIPTVYGVTVNDLPVPIITGNAAACLNSTGNVYNVQLGMTNYGWSVSGGTITAGGTSSDASVTITWTSVGAKSVSVNYSNVSGCTAVSPTLYNVTVNPLPATSPIWHN